MLPHVPGIEVAGVVAETGLGVEHVALGARVLVHAAVTCGRCRWCRSGRDNYCLEIRTVGIQTPGGYCERYLAPAGNLTPLPDGIDFVRAAAIETQFGTAWEMVARAAAAGPEDVVLVVGATGGVGHACVQVAKLLGATVIALGSSESKLATVRALGADHIVDTSAHPRFSEVVRELTGGRGADVVAESVGAATWEESLRSAARTARIVVGGAHAAALARLDLGVLFANGWEIYGITRAPRFVMDDCVALFAESRLRLHVHATYPLERVNEALAAIVARTHVGKLVIFNEGDPHVATNG
jgi:NADPH:quinone reductase-like Zn-dependent oxidoreductase